MRWSTSIFRQTEELMFSRKRLCASDEFFMFLMSVRLLKDKKEDKKSAYPFTFSGEMASVEERLHGV